MSWELLKVDHTEGKHLPTPFLARRSSSAHRQHEAQNCPTRGHRWVGRVGDPGHPPQRGLERDMCRCEQPLAKRVYAVHQLAAVPRLQCAAAGDSLERRVMDCSVG